MRHALSRVFSHFAMPAAALLLAACSESIGPEPDPDPSAEPIRFAATFPETGYLSGDGAKMRNGYALAVEMLNQQGGIGGREVVLTMRDDASDPGRAADIYREFVSDPNVDVVLGPFSSVITEAVLQVTEAAGKPLVTAMAGSSGLWAGWGRQWTVQLAAPARTYLNGSVELAAANGAETVALIWEDSRFPRSVASGVREAAVQAGLRIVVDQSYAPGRADHGALAMVARNANADVFLGGGYLQDAIDFAKAAEAADYAPQLMGLLVGPGDPGFASAAGNAAAQCVTSHATWAPSLATQGPLADNATFIQRYRQSFGEPAHYLAAGAFGAVELVATGLRASLHGGGQVNDVALRDFLFSTTTQTVSGPYGVAPLGDPSAGVQRAAVTLQLQWQDDGQGGLTQRIVHPAQSAQANACFRRPGGPLRLAATFPASGYLYRDGDKMRDGYALAVEMLNEQGGLGGRRLELVMRDDHSHPDSAARIYAEFAADEDVDVLLGPYSSVITEAVIPVVESAGRPMIAPMAASAELWEGQNREWTVQLLSSARNFLKGAVELAAEAGARNVALVWEDSRFPASVAAGVREAVAAHRLRMVMDRSYPPGRARHQLLARAAKNAGADLFVGGGYFRDAAEFVLGAAAEDYEPRLASFTLGPADPGFADEVGDGLAQCVTSSTPWLPTLSTRGPIAASETFVARHQNAYGNRAGYHAAGGFAAVELVYEGLKAAVDASGEIDDEALRDFLFGAEMETVLGAYGVEALGHADAGRQRALQDLTVQWQDDGRGGLVQRIVHPESAADGEACFSAPVPPIRVAATFPATGYLSEDGGKMRQGYALAVKMFNEQGGFRAGRAGAGAAGRMLELTVMDDGSNAQTAARIYRRYVADPKVDVLLGPYASPVTEAVLPVTEAAGRPLIAAMAASSELWDGKNRRWSVQMLNSAATYLRGSVALAAENGATTAALVWEDSRFPASVAAGVRAAAAEHGLEIVVDASYPPGMTDAAGLEALASMAKNAGADLFVGGGYLREAIGLTRAAAAVDYAPQLMSWNIGPADPSFPDSVGDLARCVAGNTPWIASIRTRGAIAASETFVRRFQEEYGVPAGYHAAGGFGAVELLVQSIQASLDATGQIDHHTMRNFLFAADTETVLGPFRVAPRGHRAAGSQQALTGLQVQWQDDGAGGLTQRIIHPASAADAPPCFNR